MPPDLFKYLFEIAPVIGVLGWWIISLRKDNYRLIEAMAVKDKRIEKEVDYNKDRDRENLKAILESASVLKELSEGLRQSEGKIVGVIADKADDAKSHMDTIARDLKERIERGRG